MSFTTPTRDAAWRCSIMWVSGPQGKSAPWCAYDRRHRSSTAKSPSRLRCVRPSLQTANACRRYGLLCVRLGSRVTQSRLPLFPQQQTLLSPAVTSDKCEIRTRAPQQTVRLPNQLVGKRERLGGTSDALRLCRLRLMISSNLPRLTH
jgi:hypothetical protein